MSETVKYGQLPSGLVPGWDGIIYWYQTNLDMAAATEHEDLVRPIIEKQMEDSYDHGQEWRVDKIKAVIWEEWRQVTLCSFYIHDAY